MSGSYGDPEGYLPADGFAGAVAVEVDELALERSVQDLDHVFQITPGGLAVRLVQRIIDPAFPATLLKRFQDHHEPRSRSLEGDQELTIKRQRPALGIPARFGGSVGRSTVRE